MENKDLLAMNLQFFAEEGDSSDVSEAEVVDQPEGEDTAEVSSEESEGVNEEAAEPQFQTEKANAAFADMRRRMEAAERRAAEIDSIYAKQFGNYKNPETGQPIRNARDYAEAIAAQQRMSARQQLQENNIDPNLIDNLIANSPVIRQAEAATAELNNIRAQKMMESDFQEVMKMDPSMSSREDIINDPSYAAVVGYCMSHQGTRFSDAYKIVNFDRLSNSKTAAAKQAVVNQVKGQSHLFNGKALTTTDTQEDIPANLLENFREMFPEKSMKELKVLYNKTLTSRR